MISRKSTLVATATMLVISILLLTTASLAWFTMSTNPEISGMQVTLFADRDLLVSLTGEPDTFTQSISLADVFKEYAALKPISTWDGKSWFLPSYNADGSITDPSDFKLADPAQNMNVKIYDVDGNPLTGKELFEAQGRGYYVSCTFYLATESEDDVTVTLSAPDLTKNNLEDWETDPDHSFNQVVDHSYKYGSYILPSYIKDTYKGVTEALAISNNAQTALRVGFMVGEGTESEKFTIYEPNADLRSVYQAFESDGSIKFEKPTGENTYVHGYTVSGTTYKDNRYIPTLPIKAIYDEEGNLIDAVAAPLTADRLIVQLSSKWNEEALKAKVLAADDDSPYFPNSGDVSAFGKFIRNAGDLGLTSSMNVFNFESQTPANGTDLASDTQILTLQGRTGDELHPQQVTMYLWVEGQDVDCWNDVSNGTFVLNLEFAARKKESVE